MKVEVIHFFSLLQKFLVLFFLRSKFINLKKSSEL